MKTTQTLPSTFIITAIENGKRVYAAIDSNSGGYPYWARDVGSAEKSLTKDMNRIMSNVKLLRGSNITDICVAEVQTTLVLAPISTMQMEAEEVQKEIDELEAKLAEKRNKMQNIIKG